MTTVQRIFWSTAAVALLGLPAFDCSIDNRTFQIAMGADAGPADDSIDGTLIACTKANTQAASADGVLSDFINAGVAYNYATPETPGGVTIIATAGALQITENQEPGPTPEFQGVTLPFGRCIDASAFAGVEFAIAGSLSGCTMQYETNFTEVDSSAYDPFGSCQPSAARACFSPQISVAPTGATTTIKAPWIPPQFWALGSPDPNPNDPAHLVSLQWQFSIPAAPDGGSGTCVADVTITNLAFYH